MQTVTILLPKANSEATNSTETNENTVASAIQQQMQSELNEGGGVVKEDTKVMLLQKYGLMAPQLTPSEQNLIRREEKWNARYAA